MHIETTINMDDITRARLDKSSALTGLSSSRIISEAMKLLARRNKELFMDSGCVRYQERRRDASWEQVHLVLDRRDYDLFCDMKKFFRRSVSLLVVLALVRYMEYIVDRMLNGEYNEEADNYPFQCYAIIQESIDSAILWKIYWGLPENPARLLIPTP